MSGAHDPQYIEFIARLRSVRKAKGLSQKELGELLNKPQSFVSKVETCERRLDVIEAAEWCVALGIRLEETLPPPVERDTEDLPVEVAACRRVTDDRTKAGDKKNLDTHELLHWVNRSYHFG
jgi:transcriptional regulator with XRE-family HTH domain